MITNLVNDIHANTCPQVCKEGHSNKAQQGPQQDRIAPSGRCGPSATKFCSGCKEDKQIICFNVDNKAKDKLQPWCKACQANYIHSDRGRASNRKSSANYGRSDKGKECQAKYVTKKVSEFGYGAYIITFASGDQYIGSGQLYHRQRKHLGGHSGICLKLKSKGLDHIAITFDVLYRGSKEDSLRLEAEFIKTHNNELSNLLNTHGV